MQELIVDGSVLVVGIVLGAVGTATLLRGANGRAMEIVKAQSDAAIAAAKAALAENLADASRKDREDLLALTRTQIGPLVDPIQRGLEDLRRYVAEADKGRAAGFASLATSIEQMARQHATLGEATNRMSSETRALMGVLRGSQARGRWGEVQLRNVVEMAGMTSWCDFAEQTSAGTGGEGRPDLTVRLPGKKIVFVDAKAPMAAYLEAGETEDEARGAILRKEHAKAVKAHIDELARRAYHDSPGSLPYTVMFLPGDPILLAAMAENPALWEYAFGKGVLLCSPMTIMALLRTFATYWQNEQQNERAEEIANLGDELYRRLAKFAGFFNGIGQAISTLNVRYNEAAGSFSGRLLPQARRMHEAAALGVEQADEPALIDAAPRQIALGEAE